MTRRFLIFQPPKSEYYGAMLRGLADGLHAHDCEVALADFHPRTTASNWAELDEQVRRWNPTDTLAINAPRHEAGASAGRIAPGLAILSGDGKRTEVGVPEFRLPIPARATHHRWVQDLHTLWKPATFTDGPEVTHSWVRRWTGTDLLGASWLPPATDYHRLGPSARAFQAVDVAFAGFVPEVLGLTIAGVDSIAFLKAAVQPALDASCFRAEQAHVNECFERGVEAMTAPERATIREHADGIKQFLRATAFRYLQRTRLVDQAVEICARRGWSLALYGRGWETRYPNLHRGWVTPGADMATCFRSAKVNLQVNGDTNLHARTLECLASDGFVLAQSLPDDLEDLRGTLEPLPTFEENTEDLEETLAFWLDNPALRAERIEHLALQVRAKHSWHARAEDLLQGGYTP